jgi:hypothetical protein
VSTADFNGDGWIDVFVANDGEDNLLWLNQRDGTLRESGLIAGVAVTAEGKAGEHGRRRRISITTATRT